MSGVLSSLHYLDVIEQEDIYKGYEDVKQASTDIFNNYLNFDSVTAVRNYGTFWCLDVRLKDKTEAEIERLFFDNKIYLGIWNDPIARKQILIHTPNQVHADYFESLDQRLTAVLKELE
jgi:adenosylmethionine-8-amino-7-oxononanoate aminotransferase